MFQSHLILSKQDVLKTHAGFPQPCQSKSPYTVFIVLLLGRLSWNKFDMGFESACSATCIGMTHQGIRCIFSTISQYTYTASAHSNPLSLACCVLSHGYDKFDIRRYKFTRCKMDLDDYKQWHDGAQ